MVATQAQTKYYKALFFNSKAKNCEWSGWVRSNVRVTINFARRHIEIDSNTPQIIDFTALTESKKGIYKLYSASATDRSYNLMQVTFQVYTTGVFYLTIQYDEGAYSYSLVETDPD